MHARLVPRAERQVRSPHLPYEAGLEPDIRLVLASRRMRVEGLGPVDNYATELLVQLFEDGL